MEQVKTAALLGLMILLTAGLFGCGKKADEKKPLADVEAEAEKMDVAKLRKMALTYKDTITAKQDEIKKISAKLQELGIAKSLTDEAKALTADISELKKSLTALTDRFNIYYKKLKEKGGDTSGLIL
ncbi:MAG: hypothetical protein PVG93_02635 [Phycisphaerales bacterium]|jgi:hypothetical protein